MLNPDTKDLLNQLGRSHFSRALRNFLEEEIGHLNDVSTILSFDEVVGRQKAIKTLNKLFTFIGQNPIVDKKEHLYT